MQVANFEYVDEAEVEAVLEEEARLKAIPDKGGNANRMDYWDELLKDKYKELKVDEFMSFGKGKRSRKPVRFYSYVFGVFQNVLLATQNYMPKTVILNLAHQFYSKFLIIFSQIL